MSSIFNKYQEFKDLDTYLINSLDISKHKDCIILCKLRLINNYYKSLIDIKLKDLLIFFKNYEQHKILRSKYEFDQELNNSRYLMYHAIISDNLTSEQAEYYEILFIKIYRAIGLKLTNTAEGGLGFSHKGIPH